MSDENIHIKLGYFEALGAKKDVLSSEIASLKIAKHVKAYRYYRNQELDLKFILYKKIKELKTSMGFFQKALPKLSIPSILKHSGYKEEDYKPEEKKSKSNGDAKEEKGSSIEDQLWQIQRRLSDLQAKNF